VRGHRPDRPTGSGLAAGSGRDQLLVARAGNSSRIVVQDRTGPRGHHLGSLTVQTVQRHKISFPADSLRNRMPRRVPFREEEEATGLAAR
jgi:hypothetical protein